MRSGSVLHHFLIYFIVIYALFIIVSAVVIPAKPLTIFPLDPSAEPCPIPLKIIAGDFFLPYCSPNNKKDLQK
jgi:hypothetical protein